jgi:hypothetical protein
MGFPSRYTPSILTGTNLDEKAKLSSTSNEEHIGESLRTHSIDLIILLTNLTVQLRPNNSLSYLSMFRIGKH